MGELKRPIPASLTTLGTTPRTTLNNQSNLLLQGKEPQEAYLLHLHDHNCMIKKTVSGQLPFSFHRLPRPSRFFIFASFFRSLPLGLLCLE